MPTEQWLEVSYESMVQDMDATLAPLASLLESTSSSRNQRMKQLRQAHHHQLRTVGRGPHRSIRSWATLRSGSLVDDLVGPFARFLLVQTVPRLLVLGEAKSVEVLVRKLLRRGVVGPVTQDGGSSGDAAARLSGFRMLRERIGAHGLHNFEDLSFGAIILNALVDVSGHRSMLRVCVPG